MTRLKDATYEAGSLTGSDGATSTSGTVTLDTTSKVKGVNSAFINTVPSFQRFDVTATGSPDAAFGSPFASSSTLTQTGQLSRVDIGNTSGALTNSFYHDNMRIDNGTMPINDVVGGVDTPKTITVSVTNTIVLTKN